MFLHRVKMNWKKHQTLTLTILLVALARIVLENVFGDGLFSDYAILKFGVVVAGCNSGLGVPQDLLGIGDRLLQEALHLRGCIAQILPRLLEQNGGSVNGTDPHRSTARLFHNPDPALLSLGRGSPRKTFHPLQAERDREVSRSGCSSTDRTKEIRKCPL